MISTEFSVLLTVSTVLLAVLSFIATRIARLRSDYLVFSIVLTISTAYYGLAGPYYWYTVHSGVFAGAIWQSELVYAPILYVCATGLLLIVTFFSARITGPFVRRYFARFSAQDNFRLAPISIASCAACIYVVAAGSAARAGGYALTENPILLILYQFTEVPIAIILYYISTKGFNWKVSIFIVLYCIFVVFSGFRYRLVILLFPALVLFFFFSDRNSLLKKAAGVAAFLSGFAFLGVLTLIRQKFEGLDLSRLESLNASDYLYGVFAESNIVFGLLTALHSFDEITPFVGFQPLVDAIVQFVPRFMYPEKDLYGHFREINFLIAGTNESAVTSTAIPFFAEYYVMAGWSAVFIGIVLLGIIVSLCLEVVFRLSDGKHSLIVGASLVAIFFGYYYFGRGSISQVSKGFIFTIIPYLYFLFRHAHRRQ